MDKWLDGQMDGWLGGWVDGSGGWTGGGEVGDERLGNQRRHPEGDWKPWKPWKQATEPPKPPPPRQDGRFLLLLSGKSHSTHTTHALCAIPAILARRNPHPPSRLPSWVLGLGPAAGDWRLATGDWPSIYHRPACHPAHLPFLWCRSAFRQLRNGRLSFPLALAPFTILQLTRPPPRIALAVAITPLCWA